LEAKFMKMHCDFCRGKLGLLVHRHWHMRFCSSSCVQGYEQRRDETRAKMRRLDDNTRGDNAVMDGLPGLAATSPVAGI
jgi:hypothetical protein